VAECTRVARQDHQIPWVKRFRPPPPPRVIPDWRRFERDHPRSSQIGVDFSDYGAIGVGFASFGVIIRCPDHPSPSPPHSSHLIPDWRRLHRLGLDWLWVARYTCGIVSLGYALGAIADHCLLVPLLAKFSKIVAFGTLGCC